MTERRRSERLPVQLPVLARSAELSTRGVASNLSRNGLFLEGAPWLGTEGTEVTLSVDLHQGPVDVVGEVVRTAGDAGGPGVGIRFTKMRPDVRRELANYMIARHYQARA